MIPYQFGDRVICIQTPAYVPVGSVGTILTIDFDDHSVEVSWDCKPTFIDNIDFDGIEVFEDECEIPL